MTLTEAMTKTTAGNINIFMGMATLTAALESLVMTLVYSVSGPKYGGRDTRHSVSCHISDPTVRVAVPTYLVTNRAWCQNYYSLTYVQRCWSQIRRGAKINTALRMSIDVGHKYGVVTNTVWS